MTVESINAIGSSGPSADAQAHAVARMTRRAFLAAEQGWDRPVIITDEVTRWAAFEQWSPEALKGRLVGRSIEVAVSDRDVFSYDSGKAAYVNRAMPIAEALDCIAQPQGRHYYIMQKSLPESLPELQSDISVPHWIDTDDLVINAWLGSEGNLTPLHFDPSDNFLAQVFGQKVLTLFGPGDMDALYPNSVSDDFSHLSQIDLDRPDLRRFPRYADATPIEVTLNAGEMLFLPSHWWHAVRSTCANAMINFWIPPSSLTAFLNEPTGIHSLWFLYKQDFLQTLRPLMHSNGRTYLECAYDMLSVRPGAAILLAHAGVMDAALNSGMAADAARPIEQLNIHLEGLARAGALAPADLQFMQAMRMAALQTFTDQNTSESSARQLVEQMAAYHGRMRLDAEDLTA